MAETLSFKTLFQYDTRRSGITIPVYFAADAAFSRNVLGRQGWIDRIRLGLVDYEGKLYLSDYSDPV
jgi:hypothetical protein